MQAIWLPNHVIQLYPEKKMDNFYCTYTNNYILTNMAERKSERERKKKIKGLSLNSEGQ